MRLEGFSSTALVGRKPIFTFGMPRLVDGRWLVSGNLTLAIQVGSDPSPIDPHAKEPPVMKIDAPFVDAPDEEAAIEQAAAYVERLANQLLSIAKTLQGKS